MKNPKKIYGTLNESSEFKNWSWFALSILLLIVIIIRYKFLYMPLERDEGEYAYLGQLILKGIMPFKIAYSLKFPGGFFMYAVLMFVFGQSVLGVHLGLLFINLVSVILIFLLVKNLINYYAAFIAASAFAILSVSNSVVGFAAHATHFVVFWALAGSFMLFKCSVELKKLNFFLCGLFMGLATLMKQQGLGFSLFGFFFLLINFIISKKIFYRTTVIRIILFVSGGLLPFLCMILIIQFTGVFHKFFFWTFDYAYVYVNEIKSSDIFERFRNEFISAVDGLYLIWILAGSGLIVLFFHPNLTKDSRTLFIFMFFIFSFLSVCPGFYFRKHYFIVLLPAISLLFSVFINYLYQLSYLSVNLNFLKFISIALFLLAMIFATTSQADMFFKLNNNKISRDIYGCNPFIESVEIARYIKANSDKKDKIAILGSEPQIFFYADRLSASGYICTYSLMENQKYALKMQKEMINDIESELPEYFISVHVEASWMVKPDSKINILNWIEGFLNKNNYNLIGITDIYTDTTIYKWNNDVINYKPHSINNILIYKRH